MKDITRRLLSTLLIFAITLCLFGCKKKNAHPDPVLGIESYDLWYGFGELCTDGTRDFLVNAFEISSSYESDSEDLYNGSGYCIILGVETNLIEHDFTHPQNDVYLRGFDVIGVTKLALDFLKFDAENGKLVYGIPYNESVDYDALSKLKVSPEQTFSSPMLDIQLKCFDGDFKIGETDYHCRHTAIHLE